MSARDGNSSATDGVAAATVSADGRTARLEALVVALAEANEQLQRALESRVLIEQAKGVLAERFSLDVADAFELLRRSARDHRMRLHDLAAQVVESRETPVEIRPVDSRALR